MELSIEFNPLKEEYSKLYKFSKYCVGEFYEKPGTFAYNSVFWTVVQAIQNRLGMESDTYAIATITPHEGGEEFKMVFNITSEDGVTFKITPSYETEDQIADMGYEEGVPLIDMQSLQTSLRDSAELYAEYHFGSYTAGNSDQFEDEVDFFMEGMAYIYKKKFGIDIGRIL